MIAAPPGQGATPAPLMHRPWDVVLIALAIAATLPVIFAEASSNEDRGYLGAALLAAVGLCGIVGLVAREGAVGAARRGAVAVLILAALVLVMYEVFLGRQIPVIALAHFMMTLASARLLSLRTPRDRVDVVVISLVTLVMGAMVSANIAFGLVLLLYVTVGSLWIMHFRLATERIAVWDRHLRRLAGPTPRGAPAAPAWRRFRLWRIALVYAAGMCVMVVLLFVMFPRQVGRRLELGVASSFTDFTTQVDLNQIGSLLESDQPVMRVRLKRNGVSLTDAENLLYLRGRTLTRYINRDWVQPFRSVSLPTPLSQDNQYHSLFPGARDQITGDSIEQEIWLDQLNENVLFAMYPPAMIASSDLRSVELLTRDMTLRIRSAPGRSVSYRLLGPAGADHRGPERQVEESAARPGRRRGGPAGPFMPGEGLRDDAPPTSIESTIPPRVAGLARQIAEAPDGRLEPRRWGAAAGAIERYLRSDRFRYTLESRGSVAGRDPVESFLFDTRRGYCEHFASAMTLMCQALGMEARLVLGYCGGEYNTVGEFYRVRRRNAHAWVEVKLPQQGWTAFDPTPARGAARGPRRDGLRATLNRWYDYLQFEWASLVVSFDAPHREELWEAVKRWWARLSTHGAGARGWMDWARDMFWGPSEFALQYRILYWLMLVLIVTLAVLVVRAAWIVSLIAREYLPRSRSGGAIVRAHKRDARFYDRLLVQLARRGHLRSANQTPAEFAAALAQRHPRLAGIVELTNLFYLAEYGGRPLDAATRRGIRDRLANLRDYGTLDPAIT